MCREDLLEELQDTWIAWCQNVIPNFGCGLSPMLLCNCLILTTCNRLRSQRVCSELGEVRCEKRV